MENIDVLLGGYRGYLAWNKYFSRFSNSSLRFLFLNTPGERFNLYMHPEIFESQNCFFLSNQSEVDKYRNSTVALCIGWRFKLYDGYELVYVVHDSLLPELRGWNPVVTSLQLGLDQIGLTLFRATDQTDAGPVISQTASKITYPITIDNALNLLAGGYVQLLDRFLNSFESIKYLGVPQEESRVSYSLWRDETDYQIDWKKSAIDIHRFILSLSWPYLGASTENNGQIVRVLDAIPIDFDSPILNASPGKVFALDSDGPTVVCGEGLLKLTSILDSEGKPFHVKRIRTRFF